MQESPFGYYGNLHVASQADYFMNQGAVESLHDSAASRWTRDEHLGNVILPGEVNQGLREVGAFERAGFLR